MQKIFIMHDIIYMPFHCSELGLNLVGFSVCYKEQFGVKANTLITAPGNQTISANCTCTGVVFFTVGRVNCMTQPRTLWKVFFFPLQILHLKFLRRCLSIAEMSCVYKNRALSAHWWGMDHDLRRNEHTSDVFWMRPLYTHRFTVSVTVM